MQAAQDKVDALACGDDRTTIELTPDETEQASDALRARVVASITSVSVSWR